MILMPLPHTVLEAGQFRPWFRVSFWYFPFVITSKWGAYFDYKHLLSFWEVCHCTNRSTPQITLCINVVCLVFMFMCLICHAPRQGDILSCHWLDIIAPQYRSALSLQEAANIAGTPPQVCGRSWESIIITYVCHRTNRATNWSNGCILSLWLCNALFWHSLTYKNITEPIMAMPIMLLCFSAT